MKQMWTPWRLEYILTDKQPGCLFCDILEADDDRANLVLHRGRWAFLLLNRYPYNNGHLMAVPYHHADTLEALTPEELADTMQLAALGMRALRRSSKPEGFNVGFNIGKVAGAGVADHVHCHIVPRWGGDTSFMPVLGGVRVIPESLDSAYDRLKSALIDLLADEACAARATGDCR